MTEKKTKKQNINTEIKKWAKLWAEHKVTFEQMQDNVEEFNNENGTFYHPNDIMSDVTKVARNILKKKR